MNINPTFTIGSSPMSSIVLGQSQGPISIRGPGTDRFHNHSKFVNVNTSISGTSMAPSMSRVSKSVIGGLQGPTSISMIGGGEGG